MTPGDGVLLLLAGTICGAFLSFVFMAPRAYRIGKKDGLAHNDIVDVHNDRLRLSNRKLLEENRQLRRDQREMVDFLEVIVPSDWDAS